MVSSMVSMRVLLLVLWSTIFFCPFTSAYTSRGLGLGLGWVPPSPQVRASASITTSRSTSTSTYVGTGYGRTYHGDRTSTHAHANRASEEGHLDGDLNGDLDGAFGGDFEAVPRTTQTVLNNQKLMHMKSILSVGAFSSTYLARTNLATAAGEEPKPVVKKTTGYEASESAFAPMSSLYVTPVFPQSALLNSLPVSPPIPLVGQIQGFLESFGQLIPPNSKSQLQQIQRNDSALWNNLRTNSQRAAGMFLYNEDFLLPLSEQGNSSDLIFQSMAESRARYGRIYLDELKSNLIKLVAVARVSNQTACIFWASRSLTALCSVAHLLVPCRPGALQGLNKETGERLTEADTMFPRLIGRATVRFTVQQKNEKNTTEIVLIVDGINYPITAGKFIDMVLKGAYSDTPITTDQVDFGNEGEQGNFIFAGPSDTNTGSSNAGSNPFNRNILFSSDTNAGSFSSSEFVTSRVPLEIYREDRESRQRFTVTGGAQNSAVFTESKPVQAFATNGAIGMWHKPGDQNWMSPTFFSLKLDRLATRTTSLNQSPLLRLVNNRYSLFAYTVQGVDVLNSLQKGDMIVSGAVEDGPWRLLRERGGRGGGGRGGGGGGGWVGRG